MLAPEDRLGYTDACAQCVSVIWQSSYGWLEWLSDPSFVSKFDEATLRHFFEKLKELAVANIEVDIEATKKGMTLEPQGRRPYA